ncbi:MAG: sodium-dependent transporter [Candidatus Krumholzibacteriota bacterium]|nr:sodium-dependent transporter [Candidatus Krumholzibacteriota bacterium]
MRVKEVFSSRWSLLLAALGMAVGTGNIWRFPRVIAQNGGAPFLVPWFLFLFLWSIPLLMIEFGLGKKTRMGTIGAFGSIDRRLTWMGGFVGICTLAITFYYSVVTGWCFRYSLASFLDILFSPGSVAGGGLWGEETTRFWTAFQNTGWQPVLFHLIAILGGSFIIYRGVVAGIEKANRIMLPSLFVLLIIAGIRAVTLPGASAGLNYLFHPDWSALMNCRIWLEGLTQSAWSTGAGWGLILTYAVYMKRHDDIVANSFLAGLGNNSASLLAAVAVIPTVFAILPYDQAISAAQDTGPLSTGLTFIWIPKLFEHVSGGRFFLLVFFLALSVAALSSLISMIELGTRNVMDFGLSRKRGILIIGSACFIFGLPSALDPGFFQNQDWVWSVGLLVSGFLFCTIVIIYGVRRFRVELLDNPDNDIKPGRIFDFAVRFLLPIEFLAMAVWWFSQSVLVYDPQFWWHPFRKFSVGTCLFQWGLVIVILLLSQRSLNRLLFERTSTSGYNRNRPENRVNENGRKERNS